MFNPAKLLQFRNDWNAFQQRHPKFVKFAIAVVQSGVPEGSVIEMKVTTPDGREMESNLRLSQEDIEFVKGFKNMQQ